MRQHLGSTAQPPPKVAAIPDRSPAAKSTHGGAVHAEKTGDLAHAEGGGNGVDLPPDPLLEDPRVLPPGAHRVAPLLRLDNDHARRADQHVVEIPPTPRQPDVVEDRPTLTLRTGQRRRRGSFSRRASRPSSSLGWPRRQDHGGDEDRQPHPRGSRTQGDCPADEDEQTAESRPTSPPERLPCSRAPRYGASGQAARSRSTPWNRSVASWRAVDS